MNWLAVVGAHEPGQLRFDILHDRHHALRTASMENCAVILSGDFARDTASSPPEAHAAWLIDAYRRVGVDVFPQLRGRFVFALIDTSKHVAFLVRDPMGAHPLFYATSGESLHFAPTAETVARRDGMRPELNPVVGAAFVARAPINGKETFFDGVVRLLQGHLIEVRPSGVGVRRYWSPRLPGAATYEPDGFAHVLRRAVDRVVDDRAGVFLSGGLDSAVVAAVLSERAQARELPRPVALSLAFRGTPANEEPIQKEIAARLGFEQIISTPDDLVPNGLLDAALNLAANPLGRPPELLDGAYDELARRGRTAGCSTIVGGAGGDEWLMPPTGFAADRLLRLDLTTLAALARSSRGYWPSLGWATAARFVFWDSALRPLTRSLLMTAENRSSWDAFTRVRRERVERRLPRLVAPREDVRKALVEQILTETNPEPLGRAAATERKALLDSENLSAAQEKAFDLEVVAGITSASPLLDPDVVDLLCSIEFEALIARSRAKAPARDVLATLLPDLADSWPRTVYGNALWTTAVRRDGAHAWQRTGGAPALAAIGLVEPHRLQRVLLGEIAVDSVELGAAWRALSLDLWLRALDDRSDGL